MPDVIITTAGVAAEQPLSYVVDAEYKGSLASFFDTAFTRPVFVADQAYQINAINERHQVIGSTTLMLVKATGSTPVGSGSNVLASTIDLTAAVDVYRAGTLINSTALTQLATGDAIGLRPTNIGNLPPVGIVSITLNRI